MDSMVGAAVPKGGTFFRLVGGVGGLSPPTGHQVPHTALGERRLSLEMPAGVQEGHSEPGAEGQTPWRPRLAGEAQGGPRVPWALPLLCCFPQTLR